MFVEAAYAAESGGLATTLGSVYPNPATIWPTWVAFIILFAVLYKVAVPMIVKMIDARNDSIRESLEKAEETKIEAERMMDDYKAKMAEARTEASKIIEQSRQVGETMKEEIIAKAREEAVAEVAKAKDAVNSERRVAAAELQSQVADLSVAVASKLIGQKLTAADHARLIDEYIAEVGGLNDN